MTTKKTLYQRTAAARAHKTPTWIAVLVVILGGVVTATAPAAASHVASNTYSTNAPAAPTPAQTAAAVPVETTAPAQPLTSCTSPVPVYHPQRLILLDGCATFSGTVLEVIHEKYDGDYHVWAAPDKSSEALLNAKDVYHGQPAIVLEISPACQSTPADAQAAHSCPTSDLTPPVKGDHIVASGPHNVDTAHGWNELHPLTSLAVDRPKE